MVDLNKLTEQCDTYCKLAEDDLEKTAAKKKDKGKKFDPKAKVRSRGKVVFPYNSPKVKDNKSHFELNTIEQARAALSYAGHYSKAPPWYNGSLEELKATIRRKVKQEYPSIEVSTPKKKKSYLLTENLIKKYADLDTK